jgi:hypothetical protein
MKRVAQVVLLAAATALILAPVASGVNQPSVNNALQADGGAPPPIPPIPTMRVPDGGAPPPIPPIPTMAAA